MELNEELYILKLTQLTEKELKDEELLLLRTLQSSDIFPNEIRYLLAKARLNALHKFKQMEKLLNG